MSKRSVYDKKLNKLRKAMRPPVPVHFDLVEWLKTRRYAQTTGEAERLILDGKVRNGSHTIGVRQVPMRQLDGSLKDVPVVERVQPAKFRDGLIVLA